PFISGKDSLKNEFHAGEYHITIPPTLLISALGRVPDVRQCVTMDLKEPGNDLYLIGVTKDEMGGSHFNLVHRRQGGVVPMPDLVLLFSESTTRFLVDVAPDQCGAFERTMVGVPCRFIGHNGPNPRLRIAGRDGVWLIDADLAALKEAWQRPLSR